MRDGSGCRQLLPPNTTETVDLQHLGQLRVQTAAPRHREGYAETPLTTAEPVRPMRRCSSPSSARPPEDAKAFKSTEDSGGASLHPLRQSVRTAPSSMSAGLRGESMWSGHQIMFPSAAVLIHPCQSRSSVLVDESSLYMRRDPARSPIERPKTRRCSPPTPTSPHHVVSEPVCAPTRLLMGSRKNRRHICCHSRVCMCVCVCVTDVKS